MKITYLSILLLLISCVTPKVQQPITPLIQTQYDTVIQSNTVIHLDTIRQFDTLKILASCDTSRPTNFLFVPCPIGKTITKTIVRKETIYLQDRKRVDSLQVLSDSLRVCLLFSEQTTHQINGLAWGQKTLLISKEAEINRLKRAKHRKSILVAFLLLTLLGLSLNTLLTCKRNVTYGIQ